MSEKLREKIEKAAEYYADLLITRIEIANQEPSNTEYVIKIDEAMRMLSYMAVTLEKINRLDRGNDTDGQVN